MKIIMHLFLPLSFLCLAIFTSCTKIDTNAGVLKDGLFRPIHIVANVETTSVDITWGDLKEGNIYEITLFDTDSDNSTPENIDSTNNQAFTYNLQGGTNYLVKIRGIDTLKNLSSAYAELKFKTPTENLFSGFKTDMNGVNQGIIRWLPKSNVTKLKLTPSTSSGASIEYTINEKEKENGEKTIGNLTNNDYVVEVYNDNIKRGTVVLRIEGDIVVPSGGDLAAALDGAPENSIILLEPNGEYLTSAAITPYVFKKGIKIRGVSEEEKAVIYTESSYSASDIYELNADQDIVALDFENIIFNGAKGNITGNPNNRYLFRFTKGGHISRISFVNCEIDNYDVSFFMLNSSGITVDSLIIDNCVFSNGYMGGYLLRYNSGKDHIHNVIVSNSTFYKVGGYLIYAKGEVESIIFKNCTLNEITMNSNRIMYLSGAVPYGENKGVQISNCLFGKTLASTTRGINSGELNLDITNSYRTSDYDDSAASDESIADKLNAYEGLSTDLWNDPYNGVFTFKDKSFTGMFLAGDPRWR